MKTNINRREAEKTFERLPSRGWIGLGGESFDGAMHCCAWHWHPRYPSIHVIPQLHAHLRRKATFRPAGGLTVDHGPGKVWGVGTQILTALGVSQGGRVAPRAARGTPTQGRPPRPPPPGAARQRPQKAPPRRTVRPGPPPRPRSPHRGGWPGVDPDAPHSPSPGPGRRTRKDRTGEANCLGGRQLRSGLAPRGRGVHWPGVQLAEADPR